MPTIYIPNRKTSRYGKPSRGELFGSIWASKNIDFSSNIGKARLAGRMYSAYDSGDDADFDVPVAFLISNADTTNRVWALTQSNAAATNDGLLWKGNGADKTDPSLAWTQDAIASSPTTVVDNMVIFGQASSYDRLVVATPTNLSMLNNGAWTASWWQGTLAQAALTSGNPHHIYSFSTFLIVPDGNVIHIIDDSLVVVTNRIVLPKDYTILWIGDDGNRVYIGTRNSKGGDGLVFPWAPTAAGNETYDRPMRVKARASFAGVALNGVMHVINDKGQLLADNGVDFGGPEGAPHVAALPVYESPFEWRDDLSANKMVHPNGMKVIDGKINMLINAGVVVASASPTQLLPNMPSGIWENDPELGLYCKYTLGQYDGATNNDWGASAIQRNGALFESTKAKGTLAAGAVVYTDNATTELPGIFVSNGRSTTGNRGYFVTSQLKPGRGQILFSRMEALVKEFENSDDVIVIKARATKKKAFEDDPDAYRYIISWTSTTTFTTATSGFSNAAVGDEVEVVVGKGAGALAHISAISLVGGTYTVTIDEAVPNVSGTAQIRVTNFKKLGSIADQATKSAFFRVMKRANWVQFKVELRGTDTSPELEQLAAEWSGGR